MRWRCSGEYRSKCRAAKWFRSSVPAAPARRPCFRYWVRFPKRIVVASRSIGFVFQFHHLLPEFTAFENVCIPGLIGRRPKAEVERRAGELLALVGLTERRDHKPGELSGGEQQRVAIARALVNSPAVLLADEPSGNLDTRNKEEVHRLFFDLRERLGQTIVLVTHDESLALRADRRIVMSDGLILPE